MSTVSNSVVCSSSVIVPDGLWLFSCTVTELHLLINTWFCLFRVLMILLLVTVTAALYPVHDNGQQVL